MHDEALRSGRRYFKLKGEDELKHKSRARQRVATLHLPPIHPHCERAWPLAMLKAVDIGEMVNDAQLQAAQDPLHA